MKYIFTILLAIGLRPAGAQVKDTIPPPPPPSNIESEDCLCFQAAKFSDDESAFAKFVHKNIVYPYSALLHGIEGRVYVQIVVTDSGKVRDAVVLKGIGYGCDEEALRVINMSPDWTPAMQGCQAVSSKVMVPVSFILFR